MDIPIPAMKIEVRETPASRRHHTNGETADSEALKNLKQFIWN
jgi:hypothetical protein